MNIWLSCSTHCSELLHALSCLAEMLLIQVTGSSWENTLHFLPLFAGAVFPC